MKQTTLEYEIIYSVTEQHLKEIEQWLSDKQNESVSPIYNHWDFISAKQKTEQMMCLKVDGIVVGFITWISDFNYPLQSIEYAVICDRYQQKGYGRYLINNCLNLFVEKGIKAVKLLSATTESDIFWKKVGFERYPQEYNNNRYHYKFIVDSQKSISRDKADEVIEIWATYSSDVNVLPSYIFEIIYKTDSNILKTPIIMLCDDNWRIRWSKKEKTLKDCKIKKFYKNGLFALGEILIIDKLDREDII
jgi:N-acetylglutamate synthase-like GNAT family acetyltransferase